MTEEEVKFASMYWLLVLVGVGAIMLYFAQSQPRLHREATLPDRCSVGEQVLMTSAPTAELYVCETHWVRK